MQAGKGKGRVRSESSSAFGYTDVALNVAEKLGTSGAASQRDQTQVVIKPTSE